MKKNSLLKAILITFLVYVAASWIIPGGTFSSGVYTKGTTDPLGLGDLFIYPISTSITSIFVLTGLIVLLIGGLYGVMNKTGVYKNIVEGTVNKFKGNEKAFLIISILIFAILSSLTTLTLPLIIMVPFFVAVILSLGYNKMTAMLSTVGAILVGNIGVTFGYNMEGYNYLKTFFGLSVTDNLVYKIALFVLVTVVLLVFVLKTSILETTKKAKKSTKKTKEETKSEVVIPLYDNTQVSKKKALPLVITMISTMVIIFVAMYNWKDAFGINLFSDIHTKIIEFKLNGYTIFGNILGSINPFGYWTYYELAMVLVIAMIVIGLIYNLKVNELLDSAADGMKKMLPVAALAILANVLLLIVNSVSTPFMATIFDHLFDMSKDLNVVTMTLVSGIGSIAYSGFPYLMNVLYSPVSVLYTDSSSTAVFIIQTIYGFTMLLVPTSVGLMIGLSYLEISYKEWFKANWKLLLSLFISTMVVIVVMSLLV